MPRPRVHAPDAVLNAVDEADAAQSVHRPGSILAAIPGCGHSGLTAGAQPGRSAKPSTAAAVPGGWWTGELASCPSRRPYGRSSPGRRPASPPGSSLTTEALPAPKAIRDSPPVGRSRSAQNSARNTRRRRSGRRGRTLFPCSLPTAAQHSQPTLAPQTLAPHSRCGPHRTHRCGLIQRVSLQVGVIADR